MLSLKNIVKNYHSGDTVVLALRGVSIDFRESEFVSILGPSGCGKTTLLNVIGGLDRYDSGDLVIGGRSTKDFRDADWDTYRNHSVGFVFQSYNLIAHQSVLANVELALTLSGISGEERRRRATEALERVGLGDQLNKRPNQMSGGQMQRVAIARALVNDPEILLADEPTGALDTATSVQIMDLLREVAKKRLVVMVTHNPELAAAYSTRIIRVKDGAVVDDTNPYHPEEKPEENEISPDTVCEKAPSGEKKAKSDRKKKKRSMSFFTALSLSFHNLLTKKTRTALVSVAGSIGIIGIALILSLSNGVNLYIARVQEETLTSYPISLTAESADYAAMMEAMVGTGKKNDTPEKEGTVYVDDSVSNLAGALTNAAKNDLSAFDAYLREHWDEVRDDLIAIQRSYDLQLQIYNSTAKYGLVQCNPMGALSKVQAYSGAMTAGMSLSIFSELMPGKNGELINSAVLEQYELVDGKWPEAANELVLVVDRGHRVTNMTLYTLGMCDPNELTAILMALFSGAEYQPKTDNLTFTYQDFYDLTLNLVYQTDYFTKIGKNYSVGGKTYPVWGDMREEDDFNAGNLFKNGMELKIVGVVCPGKDANGASISGSVAFTSALSALVMEKINGSEIVTQQLATPSMDVLTGLPYRIEDADTLTDTAKRAKLQGYFDTLTPEEKQKLYLKIKTAISEEQRAEMLRILNETFPSVAEKRAFLVSLFGIGNKQGSLAETLPDGTVNPANKAAAAILLALSPDKSLEEYQAMVPMYEALFGLDGVALTPGNETYDNYLSLVEAMYPTDEKLAAAFEKTAMSTIESFYGMQKQQEIATAAAERYAEKIQAECLPGGTPDAAKMRAYLVSFYEKSNSLPSSVIEGYVNSLPFFSEDEDAVTLPKAFAAALREDATQMAKDEAYLTETTAAMFDEFFAAMDDAAFASYYQDYMEKSETTLADNLEAMGATEGRDALSAINLYPVDFAAKERLTAFITQYNNTKENDEEKITYTDLVALMMSSVTVIINAISYVLIAFVSISLVVSSIMIGIITYISVLERTKEIGILRAIGASKRDISRVFNAETLIIGFAAGLIGVLATLLFCLPINLIIHKLSGIGNINAVLPVAAAFILVAISMALTLIAGIIPSRIASKKDPVEALRTE